VIASGGRVICWPIRLCLTGKNGDAIPTQAGNWGLTPGKCFRHLSAISHLDHDARLPDRSPWEAVGRRGKDFLPTNLPGLGLHRPHRVGGAFLSAASASWGDTHRSITWINYGHPNSVPAFRKLFSFCCKTFRFLGLFVGSLSAPGWAKGSRPQTFGSLQHQGGAGVGAGWSSESVALLMTGFESVAKCAGRSQSRVSARGRVLPGGLWARAGGGGRWCSIAPSFVVGYASSVRAGLPISPSPPA